MTRSITNTARRLGFAALLAASASMSAAYSQPMPPEYAEAMKTLDKQGDFKAKVLKINIPRNDLKMTIDGIAIPAAFGFGGWLAMTKGDGGLEVMMGDLVLLEDEVNPVMSALLDNGLDVTAVHNHFFFENPRIFYMHVHGHGKALDLAKKVKPAIDLIGHGPARRPSAMTGARSRLVAGKLDTAKLASIAGHEGEQTGDVFKITVGREDVEMNEMGAPITARMGFNTWAAFYGSNENAAIAGDVAMLAPEVTPVLKALRAKGLNVVSLHHHMIATEPTIYFLHYWGTGPAQKLATAFKSALNELGARKATGPKPPQRH